MLNNRKIVSIFLVSLFVFLSCTANAIQQEKEIINDFEVQEKKLLGINKTSSLFYYAIKNNELYLVIWKSDEGQFIYKYEKEKLKSIKMGKNEIEKFIAQYALPYIEDLENHKIEIENDKYLTLRGWTEGINFYNLYIYDGKEEKNMTNDRYLAYSIENYLYVDKQNQKIYFDAWNRSKYIDKDKKDTKEEHGMYVYDIKTNKFEMFKGIKSEKDKKGNRVVSSCKNPIRVPNTAYLMYIIDKKGKNGEIATMNVGTEVWIEEIPEWKSEIEAKEKLN